MYQIHIGFHIRIRSISYAFFVYYIRLFCVYVFCSIVRRISESSFQSNGDFSLKDGYQCLF